MTLLFEGLLQVTDSVWVPFATDVVFKVAVLLLLAAAATRILHGASASLRHHIWTMTFAVALAQPLLAASLPTWRVAVPAWESPATSEVVLGTSPETESALEAASNPFGAEPSAAVPPVPMRGQPPASGSESSTGRSLDRGALWLLVFGIWIAGTTILFGRLAVGVLSAWWTSRKGTPVRDPAWLSAIAEARSRLGTRRDVRAVRSAWVGSPMTWGLLRPVLLLPDDADAWPPERRRAVALHELAHVKRRDCLVHVLTEATRALHWMNPLAWIGAKRIRTERERACDDMVLLAGTPRTDYAELLLDVARRRGDRQLAWAAVSMARPSELEGRLLAILDPARNRKGVSRLGSLAAFVGISVVALPLAALQAAPGSSPDPVASAAEMTTPTPVGDAADPIVPADPSARANETTAPAPDERAEIRRPPADESSAEPPRIPQDPPRTQQDTIEAQYVEAMAAALQHEDADFRAQAAHTLGVMESPLAVPLLSEVVTDQSARVRGQVAWALGMIESADAVPAVTTLVGDESIDVRKQAVWALGMIESSDGVASLLPALTDASEEIRDQAAWALGMIESPDAVDDLIEVLRNDASPAVREQAAWALGMIEDRSAAEALAEALDDEDTEVARQAMWALANVLGS